MVDSYNPNPGDTDDVLYLSDESADEESEVSKEEETKKGSRQKSI